MLPLMVPIRTLGEHHRERVKQHLLQLAPADRYLRFGYQANDAQVSHYAEQLNFARDEIFGIFNRELELVAMAHVAYAEPPQHQQCAEFGVSVLPSERGRGYGARVCDRAVMLARNRGVNMLFIHALSDNAPMLKIARNAGASVERDGSESEAHLYLPAPGLDSRMAELVARQYAEVDYSLKKQAKQFWDVLARLQALRQDVPTHESAREPAHHGD